MKVHTRQEWGARHSGDVSFQDSRSIREAFIHHSAAPGHDVVTETEQKAVLRAMQNFHMDTRGWSDIAYHYIVFQPYGRLSVATIYEGRPLHVVPAAQMNHNTGTVAICIVQNDPEPLKLNTRWRVGRLIRHMPQVRRVRGHYEVFSTECPGAQIRAQLDQIARIAGKAR